MKPPTAQMPERWAPFLLPETLSNKMNNLICLLILFIGISVLSCRNKLTLKNTKWRVSKFSIDSNNYLSEVERNVYSSFDTSTKLISDFGDTTVFTYVFGKVADTSLYYIRGDSLFFVHGDKRDTSLIIKVNEDSLIDHRLAGVTTHSYRVY